MVDDDVTIMHLGEILEVGFKLNSTLQN